LIIDKRPLKKYQKKKRKKRRSLLLKEKETKNLRNFLERLLRKKDMRNI